MERALSASGITVRPLQRADVPAWHRLRRALWPELSDADNERDSEAILADPDRFAVFVCATSDGVVGFVDASLRQYAEGCDTSPVGCIEGWYVEPAWRRQGAGRLLVRAAEAWARSRGCREMASQALLENIDGRRAHERLGYNEVERQVCFRKELR